MNIRSDKLTSIVANRTGLDPLVLELAHLGIQVEKAVVLKSQPKHVPSLDTLLHEAPR